MISPRILRSVLPRCGYKPQYSTSNYSTTVEKWNVFTAVCLERLPIVTAPLNDLQKRYKTLLEEIEATHSFKCDHELRHERDVIALEKLKNDIDDGDDMTLSKITAQDFEDAVNDELAKFKFASIETEADKKNDLKSLERKLQSRLVLLTEHSLGKEKKYILPQGQHKSGETLRQTAERVLKETCGEDLTATFFGNAPCGFIKYKYKDDNNKTYGAKLFFYYAQHSSGQVKNETKYKWLSRNELKSSLNEKYHTAVNNFLIDERI